MKKKNDDDYHIRVQKFEIDGKDMTGDVINKRLKELEIAADEIIHFTLWRWEHSPEEKDKIFKETEDYLVQTIGQGSIGPATAAAGPLLEKKINELHDLYKKNYY